MRAVYDLGESDDSNTLLVASVNHPQEENEHTVPTLSSLSEKEVIPLPRSSQPPAPAALPFLVSKTSTLSKSESFPGLETISVSNSETRSLSMNQLHVHIDEKPDKTSNVGPPVSQGVTNIESSQTGKPVSLTQFDKECPSLHKQQSTATKHDLEAYPINHSLVSTTTPRQETKHEQYTTHPEIFSCTSATTPTSLPCTTTTCRDSSKRGQTAVIESKISPQEGTSARLVFAGSEAQPLELAQKEVCSVKTHSTPSLTSLNELHVKTTAVSGERTHPCFMAIVGEDVYNRKTKSANTNLKVVLPPDRGARLAARFDAYNAQTSSALASPTLPMKKSNDTSDCAPTILSSPPSTSTQHSTQGSDVSLASTHQLYKEGPIVGQTESARLSGPLLQQIDFSERGQRRDGLACENRAESHEGSQVQSSGMLLGMFGCNSLQSTVNTPHVSTPHHHPPKDNLQITHPPLPITDT